FRCLPVRAALLRANLSNGRRLSWPHPLYAFTSLYIFTSYRNPSMLVSSAARHRLFASSGYMPAPCRDLLVTIDLSLKGQGKLPSLCRPSILPIPDAFT